MLCFGFALVISTPLATKLAFAHPSETELLLAETDLLLLAVTSSSDFLYFLYSKELSAVLPRHLLALMSIVLQNILLH